MADLGGTFDPVIMGFLPDRLILNDEGFMRSFEKLQAANRRLTLEVFSHELDINERVLRRARSGRGTLPRFQVLKIAERLGCSPGDIIEDPFGAARKAKDERDQRDMTAWPVPLREVTSWVQFARHLVDACSVRTGWRDGVLSLVAAPAIDAFKAAVHYASRIARENPAIAAATLQDAANDMQAHGLHVLTGRYVARRRDPISEYGTVQMVYVLEVWIRRETEDLTHVVDRRDEPMTTSEEEEDYIDDHRAVKDWLTWEGKRRLALWHGDGE